VLEVEEHSLKKKIHSFSNRKCLRNTKHGGQKNLYTVDTGCHERNWIFSVVI